MQNLAKHTLALLAFTLALAPTLLSGQTLADQRGGTLDASFGAGGRVTTDFGGPNVARAVAVQPDGKIVAVGSALIVGRGNFALARYDRGGTLDTSFGTGGTVTTDFAGGLDQALSVAVQPDGRIIAAGQAVTNGISDFALARYNRDGTLDASFGTSGKVTTDFAGASDQAMSIALQPDGRIVAAGQAVIDGISEFALARYNADGTLDAGFGTGGRVTTVFTGSVPSQAFSVAVQPNGMIVAAGQANIGGSFDFALAQYNADGTLDATFGTGGTVTTDLAGFDDQAFSVAVQLDGKIAVAGQADIGGSFDFALARYNGDGTLDASFGTGGTTTTDVAGALDQARSIAVQANGQIVAAGRSVIGGALDFALARYTREGTLDASFGTGGIVITDFAGGDDQAFSVALQPDGKIVVAGQALGANLDFALARYQ